MEMIRYTRIYTVITLFAGMLLLQGSRPPAYDSEALGFDKVLFIKHPSYFSSHFYTFFIDGMEEEEDYSCFHEDNGIYIMSPPPLPCQFPPPTLTNEMIG